MPDVLFRVILPAYAAFVVAGIVTHRSRVRRKIGRDPIVIRFFRRGDTAYGYLEAALSLGSPALVLDIILNALSPELVREHLAVPTLRGSEFLGLVGLVFLTSGLVLSGAAIRDMGVSWRIGIDRERPGPLVTSGLFRRVRHPIYAGMLLVTSGMAAMTADLLSIAVAAAAWVGIPVQARLEEEFLLARYAEGYKVYEAQTGRFWPKLLD